MRYVSKASYAIGIIAVIAATASADARSYRAFDGAYNATGGAYEPSVGSSVPYDAGGAPYGAGQRGLDSSNDFQLQGR
jgi:hypothetical protein